MDKGYLDWNFSKMLDDYFQNLKGLLSQVQLIASWKIMVLESNPNTLRALDGLLSS